MDPEKLYEEMLEYGASILISYAGEEIDETEVKDWVEDVKDHCPKDEYPKKFTLEDVIEHAKLIAEYHNDAVADSCVPNKATELGRKVLRTTLSLFSALSDAGGSPSLDELMSMSVKDFITEVSGPNNIIFAYSKEESDGRK